MLHCQTAPDRRPAQPHLSASRDDQRALSRFNRERLAPGLGEAADSQTLIAHREALVCEEAFLAEARSLVAPLIKDVPEQADAFIAWFESLKEWGPGQNDPLFPWLADHASLDQMRWFLTQEVAGEAGFDDLLAMTQVKMPVPAKLEMARNYWDEMGRGGVKGMHGPMLDRLAAWFDITPRIETTVPESLALGNMMTALAINRTFAFHAVGALGVIELTAPGRALHVVRGLDRLGVPKKQSHYFALHAVLDVKHSESWNAEVLAPLVREDQRRARAIAEGAVLRLWCGQRCFERYRQHFDLNAAAH
jgi:Iron-containing redox enzyme